MSRFDYDLGILGGGAAGLTVAAGAAQFGAKTILIEKARTLGGDCLHFGCVPSKTLLRTARVWAQARRAREFGLPELQLPPVDLGAVMDRVSNVIAKIQEHDSPQRFCQLGAEIRFGDPSFADDHVVVVDGDRISAKNWVIATGSHPTLPPVEGLQSVPYWTNESVFEQRNLPRRLLVLGGGPIGLELAQAFQRLGSQVTVVEFLDQILSAEDLDVADVVKSRLQAEGMRVLTGAKAVRVSHGGSGVRLTTTETNGKGSEQILEADALLVATGREPNVAGLNLERAGVKFSRRGIPTDLRLRTNQKHIFACGDVNGRFPFTHIAGYEGGIVLTNTVLHLPRKANYTNVPWCTYTDPEVASIGLNEKRARQQQVEYKTLEAAFSDNDRAIAEAETEGKIKLLVSPKGKVLGCQIVGSHAGELIHEWITAIAGGVRLSTIAGAVHIYPTLAEISKRATGTYFSDRLFSDRTQSILRLLFHLKGRACDPGNDPTPPPGGE